MTEAPGLICRLRPLLGTFVAIEIPENCPESAEVIEAAFAAVERVETLMHPSRAGSDLARIARASPGEFTPVDPWTFEVLELAQRLNRESEEAFDPCLPLAPGRMRDLELREFGVTCAQHVALDLGGIAKGFAVDRAVEELRARAAASGLVNAGGDLRVFGAVTRTIHARAADGAAIAIETQESALAVSGAPSEASPTGHRGYYHRGKGRGKGRGNGAPIEGMTAVILAPTAAVADALCKCALLCEPALLGRLLEAHRARLVYAESPRA